MSLVNGVPVAIPPPEGYVVDFDNPQRQSHIATYCIVGIGNFLAFTFLLQRLYVQWIVRKRLDFEDFGLVIAWMFAVAIQGIITHGFVTGSVGVHAWEIPLDKFKQFNLYNVYLNPIIYAPPTALAKLVLLMFYLKMGNQSKLFLWSVYAVIFINVGSNVGIFFSAIFCCNPIRMGWDITVTDGTCINRTALFKATAAFGVITDVLIISLPVPTVLGLQMSRSKKVGILLMFTLGGATVVTSIVRLILLIKSLNLSGDPTWGAGPVSLWICIEANLLIMCACLPTMRAFLRNVAPGLISSKHGKSYSDGRRIHSGSIRLRSNPRRHDDYQSFDHDDDEDHPKTSFRPEPHRFRARVTTSTPRSDNTDETIFHQESLPKDGILQTKATDVISDIA